MNVESGVASASVHIVRSMIAALMVLSIVFPTMLQPLKVVVLGVVLACMILSREIWSHRWSSAQIALDLTAVAYCLVGLSWGVFGLLRGNPGAASMLTVHAAYPVLCVFLAWLARPGDFATISRVIYISAALVVLTQSLFIASFFGLDSGYSYSVVESALADGTAVVDAGDDYLLFTLPTVSSLLFIAPWLVAHTVLSKEHRLRNSLLLMSVLLLLILSGRRAFILGFLFSIVCVFLASRGLKDVRARRLPKRAHAFTFLAAMVFVIAIGVQHGWINTELLTERLISIFDFRSDDSNIERRLQFDALIDGIAEKLIFGNGLGAAASYVRSESQPWSYELSYIALVFQFGVGGFVLYFSGITFLLWRLYRLCIDITLPREERVAAISFLGGLVSFLVANATNPYLAKFDYMWTIFIPLALVRTYSGTGRKARFGAVGSASTGRGPLP